MPKIVPPLSETQIRAMEPRTTRYSVADGNGLVLEIMPTGNKVWRFRYTLEGKRQPLATIGDYPENLAAGRAQSGRANTPRWSRGAFTGGHRPPGSRR